MTNHNQLHQRERGAVSIFVVVFVSLLISVLTVSFIQLIVKNQQQSSNADLAQSAYDSALAGVEDAKRALILNEKCEGNGGTLAGVDCHALADALGSHQCSTLKQYFTGNSAATGEVQVKRDFGSGGAQDTQLDQAYTCVTVSQDTPDYRRSGLSSAKSHLIPLSASGPFNRIKISWFTRKDVNVTSRSDANLVLPSTGSTLALPATSEEWGGGTSDDSGVIQTPPLLRAQLIQTASNFSLNNFDEQTDNGHSDMDTLFLYPTSGGLDNYDFVADPHSSGTSVPKAVTCDSGVYKGGGYACYVVLSLPNPVGGNQNDRHAFLRLSALYNTTSYKVELYKGAAIDGNKVDFHGVQTEVDSTGRANDLFRRVKSRIELVSTDYPYPEQEIYLYGDLCKDFIVTNRAGDYDNTCLESAD